MNNVRRITITLSSHGRLAHLSVAMHNQRRLNWEWMSKPCCTGAHAYVRTEPLESRAKCTPKKEGNCTGDWISSLFCAGREHFTKVLARRYLSISSLFSLERPASLQVLVWKTYHFACTHPPWEAAPLQNETRGDSAHVVWDVCLALKAAPRKSLQSSWALTS
jgi:hypothetical protein